MSKNSEIIDRFIYYLKFERGTSQHTVEGYSRDVKKLLCYIELHRPNTDYLSLKLKDFHNFIVWLSDFGLNTKSQSRILSSLRSFYEFLLLEGDITTSPIDAVSFPKIQKKLPVVLSVEEIDILIQHIPKEHPQSIRNRAIVEVLYGCGMRVSELVELKISNIYLDEDVVKVFGKGSKERIIPLGGHAKKWIQQYLVETRAIQTIQSNNEDIVFLNRRGAKLTRVMIFTIIKDLVHRSGIKKTVSPHTFRHSFATHLLEGGADIRSVQKMLGHESISTTEIYLHIDISFLRSEILAYHPRA